ncbi:MAG: hypothetical protein ACOC3Z_03285 [Nanoarchaeota archaeon]
MNNKEEDLIYFKFEENEFVELKKVFLSIEKSLLETLKEIKIFKEKRKREFDLRDNLRKSFKSLKSSINKIQSIFPSFSKKEEVSKDKSFNKDNIKKDYSNIDKQLEEIKSQLAKIGNNT